MLLNGGIYFSHIIQLHGFVMILFIMNVENTRHDSIGNSDTSLSTEVVHIGLGAYQSLCYLYQQEL